MGPTFLSFKFKLSRLQQWGPIPPTIFKQILYSISFRMYL